MNDETSKRWRARNRTLTPGTIKFSIHANSEYPSMILQTVTGSARRGKKGFDNAGDLYKHWLQCDSPLSSVLLLTLLSWISIIAHSLGSHE